MVLEGGFHRFCDDSNKHFDSKTRDYGSKECQKIIYIT